MSHWASEYGLQIEEPEVLLGYKLYAVAEWMNKNSQLWSVIEFTGHATDKIIVSLAAVLPSDRAPPGTYVFLPP